MNFRLTCDTTRDKIKLITSKNVWVNHIKLEVSSCSARKAPRSFAFSQNVRNADESKADYFLWSSMKFSSLFSRATLIYSFLIRKIHFSNFTIFSFTEIFFSPFNCSIEWKLTNCLVVWLIMLLYPLRRSFFWGDLMVGVKAANENSPASTQRQQLSINFPLNVHFPLVTMLVQ